jgi:hypothetical protein
MNKAKPQPKPETLCCETCGAEMAPFSGWSFTGPCRPEMHQKRGGMYHHKWRMKNDDPRHVVHPPT